MTKSTRNLLFLAAGVAVVGGVAVYFATKKPAATSTPAAPALTGVTRSLTVAAGSMTIAANLGDTISLSLPTGSGAAWVAGDNTTNVGTATPISWTYQGPGTITLDWSTPTAGAQRTTLTFTTGA